MKQKFWQDSQCCMGGINEGDETSKLFGRSWRGKTSPLFWRLPILTWAVVILTWSLYSFWGSREKFFLYMTHWGLTLICLEALFGVIVTVKKSKEISDATFGLPWYVKTYWVLYNITIPVSFLITAFYWGVLKTSGKLVYYAPNAVLDVNLHGVNSALMLVELISSAHPSRLLHIIQPLFFALAYLLFTVAYYYAGGEDPWGHNFIYPVMDWSKPQQTMVVVALTGVFLALMHLLVVAIAMLRDAIARKFLRNATGIYNDGFGA